MAAFTVTDAAMPRRLGKLWSFAERQNLNMRMSMRRLTRLTNGFSKKIENHGHAVALHFMHYNFVRVHKTVRVTPAIEAGLCGHVWTMEELFSCATGTLPPSPRIKLRHYQNSDQESLFAVADDGVFSNEPRISTFVFSSTR